MRATEFIKEITKIPAAGFNVKKGDFPQYSKYSKNSKPLPGGSGLVYGVDGIGKMIMEITISDPNTQEVVGQLDLYRSINFPIPNAHTVETIMVDPDRRGQGIAKALYGIYLSILKYPLLSGSSQTPGGRRNWMSLANIPGVTVRGWVSFPDKYFDVDPKRPSYKEKNFKKLLDNIMNMGGEYLGKGPWQHYFVFDVEPGTGELAPAVKNELKLYGYTDIANVGLYAVWGGR